MPKSPLSFSRDVPASRFLAVGISAVSTCGKPLAASKVALRVCIKNKKSPIRFHALNLTVCDEGKGQP